MLQDENLRGIIGTMWLQHVWGPMLAGLGEYRARGMLRESVDLEVIARMMQYLHVGYFLTRTVFAPALKCEDAREVEKMADLLAYGAGNGSRQRD